MPNIPFRVEIKSELDNLVTRQQSTLAADPGDRLVKIDLHCHDKNSDVPDETLGRILRVSETWLETDQLMRTLKDNGAEAFTITNHNNARSCFDLLDKGHDVLVGAEFSCTLPDMKIGVHVLTFGFTPAQEARLIRLRKDIYRFLEYTVSEKIVTVLSHPLHFYSSGKTPSLSLMDRLGILFERFEGLNGQRDHWQNLLTSTWVEGMTPEYIEAMGKRTGLKPGTFSENLFRKRLSGGSDCHFGIFAGQTGTLLRIPADSQGPMSKLALEAIRRGDMAPYGSCGEEEKLMVAFLDYFCQVALNMKDPGLLRMLLHRGSSQEKLLAFVISNVMMEMRRHKYTTRFLSVFHECLQGKKPGLFDSLMTSSAFKPILQDVEKIAMVRRKNPANLGAVLGEVIPGMFRKLNLILAERITEKGRRLEQSGAFANTNLEQLIHRLEVPSHLRTLFGDKPKGGRAENLTPIDLGKLSDGLPFPALAAGVIGGAAFAGVKVLYSQRGFVDGFARSLGRFSHPRRALWLTDTLTDKNGVSHALSTMLEEIRRRDLPMDIFTCHSELEEADHLRVLKPIADFKLPFYPDQSFRLPDLLELQKLFLNGAYDRIICSTEMLMGPLALYLKQAFNVPAYAYMHTDWLDFAKRTLRFDRQMVDRVRRILRSYYHAFDGVFVLNHEHRAWLTGDDMNLSPKKIFNTSHWVSDRFYPRKDLELNLFPGVAPDERTVLFAGRLSQEKGVLEIPRIFENIKKKLPKARMVFAGTGPAEETLRSLLPDAVYLGWVDSDLLPAVYSTADVLLLPSRFDTFGCVVLEAMSCGTPVVAYNTKGPRDIILNGLNGFVGETESDLAEGCLRLLANPDFLHRVGLQARNREKDYKAVDIMDKMLKDMGLVSVPLAMQSPLSEAVFLS